MAQPELASEGGPGDEGTPKGEVTLVLDAIRRGEKEQVGRLYRLVRHRLQRRAFQLLQRHPAVSSKEEADDVVSQLWQRLERALLPCDLTDSQEFFRIANHKMHQLLTDLSRKYRGPGAGPLGISGRPRASPGRGYLGDRNRAGPPAVGGLDRLDEEDKELVLNSYYQEMSTAEIAGIMHLSERTVRRRLDAVGKTLRSLMQAVIADVSADGDGA
jgi:DNA-directed RNA polymerase specialized sigma24 family protein